MVCVKGAVPLDLGEAPSGKRSPICLCANTPPPMEGRSGQKIPWPQLLWVPTGLVTQVWSERGRFWESLPHGIKETGGIWRRPRAPLGGQNLPRGNVASRDQKPMWLSPEWTGKGS